VSSPDGHDQLLSVVLLGVPVALHHQVAEHQQALQREFDILRASGDPDGVPARLGILIDELEQRYGGTNPRSWGELDDAHRRGVDRIDLVYEVPADAADAAQRLSDLLDDTDEFCRSGEHLVTVSTPSEARAYRRWFLGEFVRQLDGDEPRPWDEHPEQSEAVAPNRAADESGPTGRRRTVRPTGVVDLQTAAALRDELLPVGDGVGDVVLDLTDVEFIDSVGMSMIVATQRRCAAEGVGLTVVVPPELTPTFRITGLDAVLDIIYR
jgi:anti-anti-sigma factor